MSHSETGLDLLTIARRLLTQPAAPFFEDGVQAEVERICAEAGLDCRRDRHGNLLVQLKTNAQLRPLVFAAHMDHPGFEILRRLGPGRFAARFNGGVPPEYFRQGTPVCLHPGGDAARLGRKLPGEKKYELNLAAAPAVEPRFGVWDLEDFGLRMGRVHARSCDDLIGVSAALAALVQLKRDRARVNVIAAITRAEEVGFNGALALAADRVLPRNALVVSLETSKEMPPIKMGQGVIIRVGDKSSIFDSSATRFLAEVAAGIQVADRGFRFQRALMSGGTCEATAYQEYGYQSSALCVALGNYHNCGPRNRIAVEFVDRQDAGWMVDLLVASARGMKDYKQLVARLPVRLEKLLRSARPRLAQGKKPV